jgi:hypothetical protein
MSLFTNHSNKFCNWTLWIAFEVGILSNKLSLSAVCKLRCSHGLSADITFDLLRSFTLVEWALLFRGAFQTNNYGGSCWKWLFVNREFSIREESSTAFLRCQKVCCEAEQVKALVFHGLCPFSAVLNDMCLFSKARVSPRFGHTSFSKSTISFCPAGRG